MRSSKLSTTPSYDLNAWIQCDWHKPENGRFYQAVLRQNLFGEWVLMRRWGSCCNRRGGRSFEAACNNYTEGLNQIVGLLKCGSNEDTYHLSEIWQLNSPSHLLIL